jgi:hypothetical protein
MSNNINNNNNIDDDIISPFAPNNIIQCMNSDGTINLLSILCLVCIVENRYYKTHTTHKNGTTC